MTRALRHTAWILLGVLFLEPIGAYASGPADERDDPPVAGQPEAYDRETGAIGTFTKVTTTAQPTDLQAEDPLTLMVQIVAQGAPGRPPPRPALRHVPAFARRFFIEDLPDPPPRASEGIWEFRYRLKPLDPTVTGIPAVRFDFFKPGILPPEKGYQTRYSDPIPLTVRPRTGVQPADIQGANETIQAPDSLFQVVEGAAVLRHEEPFALPGSFTLALVLLGVPALCAGGYALWRHRYPDAARRVRQRQSRAARQALQALESARRHEPETHPIRTAAILTDYLQQRWDLAAGEPTPREVADHL